MQGTNRGGRGSAEEMSVVFLCRANAGARRDACEKAKEATRSHRHRSGLRCDFTRNNTFITSMHLQALLWGDLLQKWPEMCTSLYMTLEMLFVLLKEGQGPGEQVVCVHIPLNT